MVSLPRNKHLQKKRSERYQQTKRARRNRDVELVRLEEELEVLAQIARVRPLCHSEGQELNRVAIRARKLRKKIAHQKHIEPDQVKPFLP